MSGDGLVRSHLGLRVEEALEWTMESYNAVEVEATRQSYLTDINMLQSIIQPRTLTPPLLRLTRPRSEIESRHETTKKYILSSDPYLEFDKPCAIPFIPDILTPDPRFLWLMIN